MKDILLRWVPTTADKGGSVAHVGGGAAGRTVVARRSGGDGVGVGRIHAWRAVLEVKIGRVDFFNPVGRVASGPISSGGGGSARYCSCMPVNLINRFSKF
jgi:hypothetical protein